MKKTRKILFILTVLVMCLSISTPVSAAVKISSKSIVLIKGQSKVLKIAGTKAKVSWSTNKKAVATVTAKGKITAKSKGSAVITAKVGKKKYTCKVKVETPKISSSKITLTKGQSKALKVSGTTQKVTWSSNKKTVATVSQKGVVTAKSAGTAKITAKVGSKKYTCTVNVTKTASNTNSSTGKKNTVQYKSYRIRDGVVVIARNNYPYTVKVDMDCLFYNASGVMVEKSSNREYALEPNRECALIAYNSDQTWSTHKVEMKVEKASDQIVCNAGKIKYSSNYGNENVMVRLENTGRKIDFTTVAILFYKNGSVIGYDKSYADVKNPGETDTLEFGFPYDSNYDKIIPDEYKIYINDSYGYVWS